MCPFFGPKIYVFKPPQGARELAQTLQTLQALAFFRWVNFALGEAPAGRPPLVINLDETSLSYAFVGQSGTVICEKALPKGMRHTTEPCSQGDKRGHVTHIAMVTPEPSVQVVLPQVIFGE